MKKGNIILPFKIYTKLKVDLHKSSKLILKSRVNFGSQSTPASSPNIASLILKKEAIAEFGESVVIGGGVLVFVKKKARFKIGSNSYITSDTHIECMNNIEIGNGCAISWGVTIIDDDHHSINYEGNHQSKKNHSVILGDKVWVGCNVTILKGTEVGDNSIVAAGSVLTGSFPANSLVAGNPARVIKRNVNWT